MKRPIRLLLLILFAAVIALVAAACGDTGGEEEKENPQSGTEYTVTFNSNGGSAVTAVKVSNGEKVTAPTAPTKTGYTFEGWYRERGLENRWDFSSDTVTGDTTLYAKWVALSGEDPVDGTEYTVTFDSNGGSAVTAVNITPGEKITAPAAPAKTGYTFVGWYKEIGSNNLWDFSSDTVTGDITLYAKWEELPGTAGLTYAFNSGNASYSVTGYTGNTKDIIIPAKYNGLPVTSIADNAFRSKSITSVIIPSGVTSIGDSAFAYCTSLESIEIPAGVTSISSNAFLGCDSLTIYARATSKPDWWASNWNYSSRPVYWGINESNYYEDGEGVKYVIEGGSAILTRAPISAESVTIASSITIGSSVYSVTSIGYQAFSYCRSLVSIEIPAYVTSIGERAFYYCTSLVSIVFGADSKLESIGDMAFYNCNRLASIEISEGVTSIGSEAFCNCTSLASIEIPTSVTSIGNSAFYGCSSLVSIEIPTSVTSIDREAFASCYSLVIYTKVASQPVGWDSNWHGSRPVYWGINESNYYEDGEGVKYVIVEGSAVLTRAPISAESVTIASSITIGSSVYSVTSIGTYAFSYCASLESIEIPASVTSIGYGAFRECDSLASIDIPAGVKSIGDSTFQSCYSLASIAIPASVTSIGGYAFYDCGLVSIEIPAGVTSIGYGAFRECDSLASIEIPAGVTSIGGYAFDNCSSLVIYARAASKPDGWDINWNYNSYWNDFRPVYWGINESNYYEDGEGVKYVVKGGSAILTRAPISAESVTIASSITIGSSVYSVTSIGAWAFSYCDSLASIEIPASVASIGLGAFASCSVLSSVVFGAGSKLESIGGYAFSSCDSLASIEIPAGVTGIGSYAFYHCSALSSVVFGADSKLESIGERAFSYCASLASVEIPAGVTSIGSYAFRDCDSLKSVTINGLTPPVLLGSNAFYYTPDDMKIYVPSGSEAAYKSASGWSGYSDRITAKA